MNFLKLRTWMPAFLTTLALATGAQAFAADPYNRDYKWFDTEGNERTSKYNEPATDPNQMKGLIASIFADTQIPGTVSLIGNGTSNTKTFGWGPYVIESETWTGPLTGSHSKDLSPEYVEIRDAYKAFTPVFDRLNKTEHTESVSIGSYKYYTYDFTPTAGLTAVIVELKDDYTPKEVNDINFDDAWDMIKSINVVHADRQMRVTGENTNSNGYLLNLKQPLGKFFVILKGDPMNYSEAPFYRYFEQLSPIDDDSSTGYVEGAYDSMLKGNKFYCQHNCGGVLSRGHAAMMYESTSSSTIETNMYLYIPDGRFYDTSNNRKNAYNYYNTTYAPYFFIYGLELSVPQSGVSKKDGDDYTATVSGSWTSKLKTITKDKENEIFYLERSTDGGTTWTKVAGTEFTFTDGNTTTEGENFVIRSKVDAQGALTVSYTVEEPRYDYDYEVTYRVFGRPQKGEGFEWVQSNNQTVIIPGREILYNPVLNISVDHQSVFNKGQQKNDYTNHVYFTIPTDASSALKDQNIGDEPATFKLVYFQNITADKVNDNFSEKNGTVVAVAKIAKNADGTFTASIYEGTDFTGKLHKEVVLVAQPGDKLGRLVPQSGDESFWLDFEHHATFSTKEKADDSNYSYRLFGTNLHKVLNVDENTEAPVTTVLKSSPVGFAIPGASCDLSFNTYTLEQIQSDIDGKILEPSRPHAFFNIGQRGTSLIGFTVQPTGNDSRIIVGKQLEQAGQWTVQSYNSKGAEVEYITITTGNTGNGINVSEDHMGNTFVLVSEAATGTYGSPRMTIPTLPVVSVVIPEQNGLAYENGNYRVMAHISTTVESGFINDYTNHGYGVWGLQGVRLPQNNSEIAEMRHHKHATDATDVTFQYKSNNTDQYEGQHVDNGSDALHVELRKGATQGSVQKPFYYWVRVRNYSRLNEQNTATATNAADRYVVVENAYGARDEGKGISTGTIDAIDNSEYSVFPHSVSDHVTVIGAGPLGIFNMGGVEVISDNTDETERVFDMSSLPAGLYVVKVGTFSTEIIKK